MILPGYVKLNMSVSTILHYYRLYSHESTHSCLTTVIDALSNAKNCFLWTIDRTPHKSGTWPSSRSKKPSLYTCTHDKYKQTTQSNWENIMLRQESYHSYSTPSTIPLASSTAKPKRPTNTHAIHSISSGLQLLLPPQGSAGIRHRWPQNPGVEAGYRSSTMSS